LPASRLNAVRGASFDVAVIGGGIIGAGIARDAALRGFTVALFERADYGSGTTSGSTRLIHGGLRYLEMLDFGLVRMDLRERETLLRIAPHLVRPLEFLVPFYDRHLFDRWKLHTGMILYEALSYDKSLPSYRSLTREQVLECEPQLSAKGLQGAVTYYDAQAPSPERLAVANIVDARDHGAVALNYAEVTGPLRDGGKITGVHVRDVLDGDEADVRARIVVNASGPWFDRVAHAIDPRARVRIRMTKGVHLAAPALTNRAVVLFSPADGRLFFVIPWLGLGWIGTTDTDYNGDPEKVHADAHDVTYLLNSTAPFVPAVREVEIYWTNAGVRSLVMRRGRPSSVSRTHRVEVRPGLVSVLGGKITGYRAIAEEVTDKVVRELGSRRGCTTAELPLPGASDGNETPNLAALAEQAARREQCVHLADFMLRRTTFGFAADQGRAIAGEAARLLANELGWDEQLRESELRGYSLALEPTHAFRAELPEAQRL
jgi:glycerol-3-phosphate dehydrogenase